MVQRKRKNKAAGAKPLPRRASKRIMELCAEDEVFVVVPREGRPSRFYYFKKYLKMQKHPKEVQPWKHRKDRKKHADPLGAVDMGAILSPMTREHVYE